MENVFIFFFLHSFYKQLTEFHQLIDNNIGTAACRAKFLMQKPNSRVKMNL